MYMFTLLSVFALGAVIGSFLNVVVLRRGTGIGFFKSSFCFMCCERLRFYELVPIFSFLAQRGYCRTCRGRIHFQYPLVESLSGVLFALVWLREMGGTTLLDMYFLTSAVLEKIPQLFLAWAIAAVLLAIAVYDIRHKIIPNTFVYLFIALALVPAFSNVVSLEAGWNVIRNWSARGGLEMGNWEHILSHLAAGLVFFLLFAAIWFFSRGRWMGLGDAKLAAGIGLFLGFSAGAAALILSFWIGAALGLILLSLARLKKPFLSLKTLTMKSEIPFAPFLIAGTLTVYFFQINFFDIAKIFIVSSI